MDNYLEHTRTSFDLIADTFDEDDRSNEILKWMRNEMYSIYLSCFRKGDRLLELNAGTGIDAVYLASKGISVHATDISPEMLKHLESKIEKDNLSEFVSCEILPFDRIGNVKGESFDGVISNFGGLNCINDFSKLSEDLFHKMKPGAKFISAVMNSICPWEIFYFLLKADPGNAFRRFKRNGIDANLGPHKIRSFYFSPKEFASQFKEHFNVIKVFSLGLFTPSPYLTGIYNRAETLVRAAMKIDSSIKHLFPFNRIGDHFVIVLERKSNKA